MQGAHHGQPLDEQPAQYVVAHVQEALAADGDVAELGVGVSVAGRLVVLTGTVPSAGQRDRAGTLAAEVAGGLEICNELEVARLGTPAEPEQLR